MSDQITGGPWPRIVLSGFDSEAEKTRMVRSIQQLKGTYSCDQANSQAYVHSCTHVVCKKPSRSEKYLAACAAGKWVLTHYFIDDSSEKNQWASEKDYEWGVSLSPQYSSALQMAPKKWRERIAVKGHDPPFLGWKAGLVMKEAFVKAYTSILEAGGGEAVDITSMYSADASPTAIKAHEQALLTHAFVTPKYASLVSKSRTEDIPYLRVEFLAMYLLNDPPPCLEEYSIFKDRGTSPANSSSPKTPLKRNKERFTQSQLHNTLTSPILPSATIKEIINPSGQDSTPEKQSTVTVPQKEIKRISNKPLPASLIAKGALVFASTKKPGLGGQVTISNQQNSPIKKKIAFAAFGGPQTIKLPGNKLAGPSTKDRTAQSTDKINVVQTVKRSLLKGVPTISLGPKRSTQDGAQSKNPANAEANMRSSPKRHFSEDFFRRNHVVLEEFAARKKHLMTSYGVLESLVNTDNDRALYQGRNARPFSREIMREFEAELEFNYHSEHFLREVYTRLSPSVYPPPDVLFVIMKVSLLDSTDRNVSEYASNLLDIILEHHPPQAPDIKAEKLYHKALSLLTAPDTDETSPLMLAVGDVLSRYDAEDWKFWCSRDSTLGTLWTFYSRVLNIAIKPVTPSYDEIGVKQEMASEEKIQNAGFLGHFLMNLVVKDYQDVLTGRSFPSHSPLIKCFLADLLWPTMTGLEPWFRRPSANLADLVSLFVRATEAYVAYVNADVPDDESVESCGSEVSMFDLLEGSRKVLEDLSRLVGVTTSWCIHCDLRDKERGKRTSSRTLESELVSVLRAELENKSMEVLEAALQQLPLRLKLKVNVALIQQSCSNALVRERNIENAEVLSLETITSVYMQMIPRHLQGEERDPNTACVQESSSSSRGMDLKDSNVNAVALKMNGDKINRRNHKGETSLHVACMTSRADTVRFLISQPGIDPNATDYAGWTALSEACNHGSIECVRALLTLPAKKDLPDAAQEGASSQLPALEINLTLCPLEGQTPLHDALGNDHLEIACLLIRKGGVELLDKVDSEGRTPLDYCMTEAARSSMIEYACKIAVKARRRRLKAGGEHSNQGLMILAENEEYDRVLPKKSVLVSDGWRERVRWFSNAIWLLLSHYVTAGDVVNACMSLEPDNENETSNPNSPNSNNNTLQSDITGAHDVTKNKKKKNSTFDMATTSGFSGTDLERYTNDVMYCLRWKECWDAYTIHICRLLGESGEAIADVIADTLSPIPTDLMANMPS